MKKYVLLTVTSIILVLMTACGHSKEKSQQAKVAEEHIKLSQVLEGQWKAEEAEGIPPHWREFEPSNNSFRTWSHNGPRLSKPDGYYEVIGDTALMLTWNDNEAPRKYGLDSLSKDYLEMWYYGVSASNLIYQRADYEENHLEDISKDTIAVEGTIIKAFDIGWAYTYGLHIDTGTDTLVVNYFTQEYSESSLRNKQVALRYFNSIKYSYSRADSELQIFEITGIYEILSYGGDLPGAYSVTDKNGRSVVFDAFLSEEDDKYVGTEVTEQYSERYAINIASIKVIEPIMNTLVFGDWNIITSDTIPIGHRQIKIRPGGNKGVYIDFGGQGDNYVKSDIYSKVLTGTGMSGDWKLELLSEDPATFLYSDDGGGGRFEPITNQKYQKEESDNRKLLIGKWQGIEDTEGYVEFTDKVMTMDSSRPSPYIISSVSMNAELAERYSQLDITGVVYISTLDDGESFLNYMILKLDEDTLSYSYMGTGNDFHFKRVK